MFGTPPLAMVLVQSRQEQGGPDQERRQASELVKGAVGHSDPCLLGVSGLPFGLPLLPFEGVVSSVLLCSRPGADVALARLAVDPKARVVIGSAALSVLPAHRLYP